ncbi:hypothetical protein, partial [Streptomyces sp. DH8]|uniref:hypothetical protein n=1 Tax=Streptomyces sp. DH8 TaxID=2857008 RepID=UPI00226C4985
GTEATGGAVVATVAVERRAVVVPTLEGTATTVIAAVAATGTETTGGAVVATVAVERRAVVVPTLEGTATTVIAAVA